MNEPWPLVIHDVVAREIPPDIHERLLALPDAVELLSDALRHAGIASTVDLGDWCANRSAIHHVGPIVTMRYAPKAVCDDEMRMGNAQLAPLLPAGALVIEDAHDCDGCVLGGYAAQMLQHGGAAVAVVDGLTRDPEECDAAGLAVIARRFGVRTGRSSLQTVEIGGTITLRGCIVGCGDVGVINRNGLAIIPAWLTWDDVRALGIFSS